MSSILPASGSGSVLSTDPNVVNVYIPPESFSISCDYTALPSSCDARILPTQINAIVSEMIALMAYLNPDGSFDCFSVTNLTTSFNFYATLVDDSLTEISARVALLEGGGIEGIRRVWAPAVSGAQSFPQDDNITIRDWTGVELSGATYNPSTGTFTIVDEGLWSMTAFVNILQSSVLERVSIYVNGQVAAAQTNRSSGNASHAESVACNMPLETGDTVEVKFRVTAESSGSYTLLRGQFCMVRLGSL